MASKQHCGKPTVDGTPCRNGPGCTVAHPKSASRGSAAADKRARRAALENAAVISDDDALEADLRRQQARQEALEETKDGASSTPEPGPEPGMEAEPPPDDRPGLAATIQAPYSDGDSDDGMRGTDPLIPPPDSLFDLGPRFPGDTAPRIGELARTAKGLSGLVLKDLQDIPIRGEGFSEPDWQEPNRITRLRTEAEMIEWRELASSGLPEETTRVSVSIIDGEVEAVAESHMGRVCCGNPITFDKPWCPGCGTTHSAAVLAQHTAELKHVSANGGSHPFRYRAGSLCYVAGEDEMAARMADPETFAERARDTLKARIAYETADAVVSATIELDRLDAALHQGAAVPDSLQDGIDFGMPEPCDTFSHRMVLTTEPEDEDETAAKDLAYGDPVAVEAHVRTVTPDGAACWRDAGRIDAEWSPMLAGLCR